MMAGICNLLYLAIIAVAFSSITAVDYCKLQSCVQNSHTMCIYSSPMLATACVQWSNNGLSDAENKEIVDKHNQLRRKVASGQETRGNPGPQPAAVSMPDLTWDNELAMIAQRWANQCNFSHDKCRNVDRYVVGQNMAATYYSGENISTLESMVQLWYDEVDKFDRNKVSRYEFEWATGHYSQVVWANTTKIGCGRIKYKASNGWNAHHLVCNYGPSGNWRGERVYQEK